MAHVYPPPESCTDLLVNTDGQGDMEVLWGLVKQQKPRLIVELGTRGAVSTRIMRLAAPKRCQIHAVDPDGECVKHLPAGVIFHHEKGEDTFWQWGEGEVDILFIDTDPHSYPQTIMWLNTWVSKYLSPHGVAIFHDTLTSEVGAAIADWVAERPHWEFYELGTNNGLGVLRFMGG